MSDSGRTVSDPALLLESARVLNAAGPAYRKAAEVVAEQAWTALEAADRQDRNKTKPEVRQAILGDAAALRLSGRLPGGHEDVLNRLKDIPDTKEADLDGRLHLLRALAQGQEYNNKKGKNTELDDPGLVQLREKIRQDLAFSFDQDPTAKQANRCFWQPDLATPGEDDLAQAVQDARKQNEELGKLVDQP
jgi:hypothetical protein